MLQINPFTLPIEILFPLRMEKEFKLKKGGEFFNFKC